MIYIEYIKRLLEQIRPKIQLTYDPNHLKLIQEYIEASDEFEIESIRMNLNTVSDFGQSKVGSPLNLLNNRPFNSLHTVKNTQVQSFNPNEVINSFLKNRIDTLSLEKSDQIYTQFIENDDCKPEKDTFLDPGDGIDHFNTKIINFLENFILNHKNKQISILNTKQSIIITGIIYGLLGKCLVAGLLGLEKNPIKAVEYFIKSVSCQNPMGTFELANCYEKATGVEYEPEKACQLYRASYKLGYIKGLHKYAIMLIRGDDYIKKNILDGYYILKQTITNSNHLYNKQYYDLGMLYKSGVCDIFNDYKYALKIFQIGAERGCKHCQYKLGEECELGNVFQKNMETAFIWYRKSAMNNLSDGQYKVATLLYGIKSKSRFNFGEQMGFAGTGKVVLLSMNDKENAYRSTDLEAAMRKNKNMVDFSKFYSGEFNRLKEAYKMAYKAALGGKKESVLLVAEALEKGFGVEKSLVQSIWWYKLADKMGCEKVREKITILENKIRSRV